MAERVLVLSASPWEFKSDSGEMMRGVTVEFIMPEISHGPRVFGSQIIKETADARLADVFRKADLPALMDLEVGMARGKDMKSKMVIKGATAVAMVRPFNQAEARKPVAA